MKDVFIEYKTYTTDLSNELIITNSLNSKQSKVRASLVNYFQINSSA